MTEAFIWYRLELPAGPRGPGFVVGLETDADGRVLTAPPIAAWTVGKNITQVAAWAMRCGGSLEPLDVELSD